MMKIVKIMLVILLLGSISVLTLGCGSESESEAPEKQEVAVQRGDLAIDITAVGNLFFSHEEELAFEVSGTVGEVLVEIGDSVEEGQALVKLDISDWEEQLDALEHSLTTAERNLTTAERNLTSAERKLATKLRSLLQAEVNLKNAQIALLDAQSKWYKISPTELEIKEMQVEIAEMSLEEAQNAVADAEQDIADAQQDIADAQQTVADAQQELDEAKATSPVISAPFAGIITKVNVSVGGVVKKGAVAVILADPSEFGAAFMVGEIDILQVKLGGGAWVQVDAMLGMSLPAKVTHISPTATIQQGVVNYRVKVEIESLEAVRQERQEAGREAMQGITQGELPERIRQAIEEGRITQEQAEEMIERMQQGELPMQPGQGGQLGQGGQHGQVSTAMPEDFQLREGLTVTVSILVEERNDVLLVPNAAITSRGGQAYVTVVSPDDTLEERAIQTGLSDWQFTEVIEGLSEGEKIIVPQGTTTTPTTPQQRGQGGIRIPGMGSPH